MTPRTHRGLGRRAGREGTSMKGGFNDPPNLPIRRGSDHLSPTSMKGGFNDPPNVSPQSRVWPALPELQ